MGGAIFAKCDGEENPPTHLKPELPIIEGSLNSKFPTIWRVEKQMKSR